MLTATYQKYTLRFKQPSGTSRGVLHHKDSYFITIQSAETPHITGIGECGLLRGLSADDVPEYENQLAEVCLRIHEHQFWINEGLQRFPSIYFGLEMALLDFQNGGKRRFFPSPFLDNEQPIPINGLVWMGNRDFMFEQIKSKLEQGWRCLKLKIGAIPFEQELELLKYVRQQFSKSDLELRVDANGAFSTNNALEKLKRLSELGLHSIEQPLPPKQWDAMATLCEASPLPVALDEELIGIFDPLEQEKMLATIRPHFLIFKPSFIGGFRGTQRWIDLCERYNVGGWWLTSALESSIGLNAIAQWTATLGNELPQGLGTGQLYTNNFPSPLESERGWLTYRKDGVWDLSELNPNI